MHTSTNKKIITTSSHHQAQYPFDLQENRDYKLLAWNVDTHTFHLNGNNEEIIPKKEAEIVFYPKTKCLAIQGHPEWMSNSDDIKYYQDLVFNLLKNNL